MSGRKRASSLSRELEETQEELKAEREARQKSDEQLAREREQRVSLARELDKLRRQAPGKIGCVDEGSKKWEVEVAKIGEKTVYSDYTSVGGLPFRIGCLSNSKTESGEKNLAVYLFCNDKSPANSCSACVAFTLTLASTVSPQSKSVCYTFNPSALNRGWPAFITLVDATDPGKGYIEDGCLTIEAQIKVIWCYKNIITDFSSPDPKLADVILLVGGKKFYANKRHLALYCEFFKYRFFSDFSEKDKQQLELPDMDPKDFEELLRMICPQRKDVTVAANNVKDLLRLADIFDVDLIRAKGVDFLKATADFSLAAKLHLSEQFRLPELQADILDKIKTRPLAQRIVDSTEFNALSDPLKNHIQLKLYNLK